MDGPAPAQACGRLRLARVALRNRCSARRRLCSLAVRAGVVSGFSALAAAGTVPAAAASGPPPYRSPASLPLATSVRTLAGTWATVPIGRLGQPLNTFWQLMFEPSRSSSWSDRVEATGAATNGGIVLAARAGSLVVGVRPSNLLTYSPLIATTNSGRSWSTGLLENGLAHVPSSLALSPSGAALALAPARRGGRDVLASRPGAAHLVAWEVLLGSRTFASTAPAERCAPASLTAVGYAGTAPVVGAACRRGGAAGLFTELGHHWTAEGPQLPRGAGAAEVLDLVPAGQGLASIIELHQRRPGTESLLAAWSTNGTSWRASGFLRLRGDERLVSLGPADGEGVFVLMAGAKGQRELAVVNGPGSRSWHYLPAPPAQAQTVTFGPRGTVQALVVNQDVIGVWGLAGGGAAGSGGAGSGGAGGGNASGGGAGGGGARAHGARWHQSQAMQISIQYGASG